MSVYKSSEFCTVDTLGYEGLFQHDRGTETLVVKDNLINEATIAEERARVELLLGGYSERWVTIKSTHTLNLTQNKIITLNATNWIVKEITLDFNPPRLIQTIKAVRYE
jgi:hypothetical protein